MEEKKRFTDLKRVSTISSLKTVHCYEDEEEKGD